MNIVGTILKILKSINIKYEKSENNQSLDLNLKDCETELGGSLSVRVNKDEESKIYASLGKDKDM